MPFQGGGFTQDLFAGLGPYNRGCLQEMYHESMFFIQMGYF